MTVSLPSPARLLVSVTVSSSELAAWDRGTEGRMATVLYVDDEEAIRRAVVAWLTRRGHTVHAAASVAGARNLLESHPVDGAFVDLWLDNESGLELQSWIDENRPDLSPNVVFVTGDVSASETASSTLGALGRRVLAKPFDLGQLDEIVERWVSKSGQSGA
jgi:DNA-binding NtrC family response regulator